MSLNRPLITVALPAFNSGRTIGAAILSILRQSYGNFELLVMDDGSSEDTVRVAQSIEDPRIALVADGVHRGLPAQLNRAIDMARGKYFARMDADDIAYPSRFQRQVEFLNSHPDVDLLGSSMTIFRNDGSLLGTRRCPRTHAEICARPWHRFPMAHPTWMGRIEWFRANRYDEHAVRMEDRELLLRTYSTSHFANIPEALLAYREDSLSLRTLLRARKNTCKMSVGYALREGRLMRPTMTIAGQIARGLLEVLAVPTGLTYQLLRSRAPQATPQEAEDWREVWASLMLSHPLPESLWR
jgi:glycosyltransferase involved in cell wall biosynthesis